jgi:MYXO-CTERM domain-containing protein
MTRLKISLVSTLAVAVGVAACSAREPGDGAPGWSTHVGTTSSPIIGGQTTSDYPFAVGINIRGSGTCSGTLIAPNLVLTARHCVSDLNTGEQIQCGRSAFSGKYPASSFRVTTRPSMYSGNPQYRAVNKVTVPSVDSACGADLALLQLASNVPANEAPIVPPLIGHTLYNSQLYSRFFTAIGYGLTGSAANAPNTSGVRRIRQNIAVACLPGRPDAECTIPAGVLDKNDILTNEGTCQGDSGSAMYEQLLFDKGTFLATGVLSRGDGECANGVYTRTDAWADFLVSNALLSATAGNYPPPAWTTPPAATADDAPVPKKPKAGGTDPAATGSALGAACRKPAECASKLCVAPVAGDPFVCSQGCDADNLCPTGYACKDAFCFVDNAPPAVTPPAEPPATPETQATPQVAQSSSSGCSVAAAASGGPGKDPTKPIPWRAAGLVLVALAFVRRRSR